MKVLKIGSESLTYRLGNLKDKSSDIIVEQIDNLSSIMSDLKDKGVNKGKECAEDICTSTRRPPFRNLMYAFGVGMLLSFLINR